MPLTIIINLVLIIDNKYLPLNVTLATRSPGGDGPFTWSNFTPKDMILKFKSSFKISATTSSAVNFGANANTI